MTSERSKSSTLYYTVANNYSDYESLVLQWNWISKSETNDGEFLKNVYSSVYPPPLNLLLPNYLTYLTWLYLLQLLILQ